MAVNTDINCASKESNGPSPNISSDIYQSLDDVEYDAEKKVLRYRPVPAGVQLVNWGEK